MGQGDFDRPCIEKSCAWKIALVLILAVHAAICLLAIPRLSPTCDEPKSLAAGYLSWKTRAHSYNADNTPLSGMWGTLPLLFIRPVYDFPAVPEKYGEFEYGDRFLHGTDKRADLLLNSARAMMIPFSILTALVIFFWSRALYGSSAAGLAGAALWCFLPLALTHATLFKAEASLTFFVAAGMYALYRWRKGRGLPSAGRYAFLFFTCMGLAAVSKFTAGTFIAAACAVFLFLSFTERPRLMSVPLFFGFLLLSIVTAIEALYGWNGLKLYWSAFRYAWSFQQEGYWRAFLFGKVYASIPLFAYPAVFMLKTPLALMLSLAAAAVRRPFTKDIVLFLLFPAALFFVSMSVISHGHFAFRFLLPAYPFLIVWAAGLFTFAGPWYKKTLAGAALLWYAASSVAAHPWYVGYVNELAGGPLNAYRYVTDSQVDWGQGLKELARYLKKENVSKVYLSYHGCVRPEYYGIQRYVKILSNQNTRSFPDFYPDTDLSFDGQPRVLFAISVTNLQSTWYREKKFEWLKDIPYEAALARSIFVYDMSAHPREYEILKSMLAKADDY